MVISVDGNFRLCRRRKAGLSRDEDKPLIKCSFFLPQDNVDAYVQSEQNSVSVTVSQVSIV